MTSALIPLATLLLAPLLAPLAALHAADADTRRTKPNILVIFTDDAGRMLKGQAVFDLYLDDRPAATPAAGQPIGNGSRGTMVRTPPDAFHLQINRVDDFAVNHSLHRGSEPDRAEDAFVRGIHSSLGRVSAGAMAAAAFAGGKADVLAEDSRQVGNVLEPAANGDLLDQQARWARRRRQRRPQNRSSAKRQA